MSAVESLTRGLSSEFAPHGIRVVGLRPLGMPESGTIKEVYGASCQSTGNLVGAVPRGDCRQDTRATTLVTHEMANIAAFAASDEASGLTGTIINLGLGSLDD
ncbi:hypothetical protein [Tunturiibacter psychrotolerans]|uniref:hypothetical protein n=1 Tax=Tunturiibacter psychrotolerans TaxID=3069686 RepID=UPI003D21268D